MSFFLSDEQIDSVERVLATESSASGLGDRLFSTSGLFVAWTKTEEDRRSLTKTAIFKIAQTRFRELQMKDGARFSEAIARSSRQAGPELFKWDGLTPLPGK
ncbi:MAG: hypothetical protein U0793_12175 [Gemmataceae bacterium]